MFRRWSAPPQCLRSFHVISYAPTTLLVSSRLRRFESYPSQLQNSVSLEILLGGSPITLWHLSDRRGLADRRRIVIRVAAACVHVRSGLWRREGRQDRLPRARQIRVGRAGGGAPALAQRTNQRGPPHLFGRARRAALR